MIAAYEKNQSIDDINSTIQLNTQNTQMKELIKTIEKVSTFDTTVFFYGESGTGKGLLAKYLHQKSLRAKAPFVVINCAALPEHLLESELFGYVEGAFTGASQKGKAGLLEAANNGTLFLDEIGELSLGIQAKLLHVLQDKEFTPVGDTKSKKVDIRIITATNKDLKEMISKNTFREDLYYRLNVIDIDVPPLRNRPDDIIPLANFFLDNFNNKFKIKRTISKEVYEFFTSYHWPGNVRELENLIEKLIVVSDDIITLEFIPNSTQKNFQSTPNQKLTSFDESLEAFEKKIIIETYQRFQNYRKVADFLNISQSRAARLIRKYTESS